MDPNESQNRRLWVLAGLLVALLLLYAGLLFDTQVNRHDYYVSQSVRSIARSETVVAARGLITDRSGRPLVSNRSTYALSFDPRLLKEGTDKNEAILRLVELCRSEGVSWVDGLPISPAAPYSYCLHEASPRAKRSFLTYLKSLSPAKRALSLYLVEHPEVVGAEPPALTGDKEAELEKQREQLGRELLSALTEEELSGELLLAAGISPTNLLMWMREDFQLSPDFQLQEARDILGVQYELSLRRLDAVSDSYVMAEDIDTPFITLLSDGNYQGAKVTPAYVREYETHHAAHILGTVGPLYKQDKENPLFKDYPGNAIIGKSGVEAAFEPYLQGKNGTRIVSTNEEGKVTGEYYSKAPQPGYTVELTIDEPFQQAVEEALDKTISAINEKDHLGATGGAAVVKVGTGEVLALASYPTYDPARYRPDYNQLLSDPLQPLVNRATAGVYPPGSTVKPLISIAALEEGIITPKQKINCPVTWYYPGDTNSHVTCWLRSRPHGKLTVTDAITVSCNYFFAEMGYQLGMERIRDYLSAFGFGEPTGLEIGGKLGSLPENKKGEDQAPWAAIGQSSMTVTPLQLANYTATLVSGGKHNETHLLKAVKTYDNSAVVALGNCEPQSELSIAPENLAAVKKGMNNLTHGSLAPYFDQCIVEAGAKTGTAQLGGGKKNNGVFICFAPYEEPEIAVAVAIEKGGAGAALASAAVAILNAYFSENEAASTVTGELELLP